MELFAHRRAGRRRVDPEGYRALHGRLVAACRDLASSADEDRRAYYERLESLVAPWVSPMSLARADSEILGGLLERCRQVERDLGGRRTWSIPATMAKVALPAMAVTACAAAMWASGLDPQPALDQARGWSDDLWLAARRSTETQKIGLVAALVVGVSIRVLSRTARN